MDAAPAHILLTGRAASVRALPLRIPSVVAIGRQRTQGVVHDDQVHAGRLGGASASPPPPRQAAEVAALVGDNTIAIVDTSQKKVVKTWNITGIAGKVLGIDVRPADGMLYALAADGGIYTVDTTTGKATMKSKLETMLPAGVDGRRSTSTRRPTGCA